MLESPSPPLTRAGPSDDWGIVDRLEPGEKVRAMGLEVPSQHTTWSMVTQGAVVEVKSHLCYSKCPPRAIRGQCSCFSAASRLRLLKLIGRMDWEKFGSSLFITLTYPDTHLDRRMKQRTQDRSQFLRAVEHYLERKVPSIWRVEWEPRKSGENKGTLVSHLHLMLLGVEYIPWDEINRWWKRILVHQGYVRTWVEKAEKGEGAAKYIAKYCAKRDVSSYLVNAAYLNRVGRHWGVTRKALIPLHEPKRRFNLSEGQIHVLREVAAGILPNYDIRYDESFTLLGKTAEKFAALWWANGIDTDIATWYIEKVEGGEEST